MASRNLRWLRHWGPAMAWAALIWTFSTESFSAAGTSRILLPLLRWLFPHADAGTLEWVHFVIRKCGHIGEYLFFSLLLLRGIRAGRREWKWTWAVAAVAMAAVYAALDEFHQSFVPSRGASALDALLDTCSAALTQVGAWLWSRRRAP